MADNMNWLQNNHMADHIMGACKKAGLLEWFMAHNESPSLWKKLKHMGINYIHLLTDITLKVQLTGCSLALCTYSWHTPASYCNFVVVFKATAA